MRKSGKEALGNAGEGRRPVLMERLLQACRSAFVQIEADYPKAPQSQYRLRDCLSVALSLFVLKFPSLCQYVPEVDESNASAIAPLLRATKRRAQGNIRTLFGVRRMRTDTTLRRRLDEVQTEHFELVFRALFQLVQRWRLWSHFQTAQGPILVALDGTQVFSSSTIHCAHCRITQHRDGSRTYSHQIVTAAVVHPHSSASLPLGAEPIGRADGARKNDCEQKAAKRLLRRLRTRHPKLPMVILADALYATGPMVQLMRECHKFRV